LPGALFSSLVITVAWGWLVATGSIDTIWPMFGIANQLLAVVALAVVGTWLIRSGRARYLAVVAIPMVFVLSTTLSAGVILVGYRFPEMMRDPNRQIQGALSLVATVFVLLSVLTFLAITFSKWLTWLTTGTGQFPAGAAGGKGANGAAAGN
jgi:carbon starvation protein